MTGKDSGVAFAKELGSAVKPIAVNNDLLQGLDQTKRLEFLEAVAGGARAQVSGGGQA
mgnify:CR=1 FL=1